MPRVDHRSADGALYSCPAIMEIPGDRGIGDISVVTHFWTTSPWLEVTPAPPLVLLSAAGQHNDARMNLAIALTAARYGAATANYMEVVSLLKKKDPETGKERVSGARCKDVLTGMPGSTREAFLSILLCLSND